MTERYRHRKRGTTYELVGVGQLQCDTPMSDCEIVVIYRAHDGILWVRRQSEFHDGRFEVVMTEEDRP